jgi:hypothetical protein
MNYGFDKQMRQAIEQTLEDMAHDRFISTVSSSGTKGNDLNKEIVLLIASCYCLMVAYPSRDDWKISLSLKPIFKNVIKTMSLDRSNTNESCIEKSLIRYCRLLIKLND